MAFSCNPGNIHNLCVCTHILRHAQRPPQLTHRGVQTLPRTTVPWYIPEPKLRLFLCLGVYMLRCGGQRLKLGVSPSSMLPYLFEAVHLIEPRGDQCASLAGQNAQGSVFSLISLDMILCVQLLYGHWRSTLKFSFFTAVTLPTEPSIRTVSCVRPSLE